VATPQLLSIVEIGGYPNFNALYQQKGFAVETADSMRKATKLLKKLKPNVVVAEFNFQSDFRDRTSSLETLMATVQRIPDCHVIVFYEKAQLAQLQRLLAIFDIFSIIAFPIEESALSDVIDKIVNSLKPSAEQLT